MNTTAAPSRSYLFVPGNRPERFDKAMASGADAVILDLEDAVPESDKDSARDAVARWLCECASTKSDAGTTQIFVRINACGSTQHEQDVRACHPWAKGVILPKSEHVIDIAALARAMPAAALLPLIETAVGIATSLDLARAPGVSRLVFGTIDFQHDLGIDGEGDELLLFRSQLVLNSRLAGLSAPIDGISTVLDNAVQIQAEANRARRLGFGGKLCIHPRQLAPVHDAFNPTAAQLDWACRVLAAADAAHGAAVALDGTMVDRPVILRAQALLERASQSLSFTQTRVNLS